MLSLSLLSFSVWPYTEFKRIGVDDGLPNATIYSVAQDQHGYIWLTSTNSGLLRFDGYKFSEFSLLTPEELQQQAHQDAGVLLIDRQSNLWAGTWGYGLSRIDHQTGELRRYVVNDPESTGLAGMFIQALFQDQSGAVWIGTTTGLTRLMPDGTMQRIGAAQDEKALNHQRIWSLTQTEDGTVWIGTSAGLHCWREETGLCPVLLPDQDADETSRLNEIRAMTAQKDNVWVGTRAGLFRVDAEKRNITPIATQTVSPLINTLLFDQEGLLLVGTFNGLYRFDTTLQQYIPFRSQLSLLPTVNVRSMHIDRTGVLWVGSRESGLFYSRHSKSAFTTLQTLTASTKANPFDFTVTSVFKQGQHIWLGSAEVLHKINESDHTHQSYAVGGRVNAIRQNQRGEIFVATDVGLFKYDEVADRLVSIEQPFRLAGLKAENIRDLLIDSSGNFWLGLWGGGVLSWQPANDQVISLLQSEIKRKIGDAVQALLIRDQQLWIGTRYSGVFKYDLTTQQLLTAIPNALAPLQLPSQDVQCLEHGPANSVLICTEAGLVQYSPEQNSQQLFDLNTGLRTANVVGAHADEQQNIWLMSAQGLTLKPAHSDRLITFTRHDGLAATEMMYKAIYNDQQGRLYVGTISGLSIVEPELIWVNQVPPVVAIPEVWINHQVLPLRPHSKDWPPLQLSPEDSSIEFKFASLDYHDVSRNQFLYRLRGFEDDWILQSDRNSAYYSNLPPGEYTLEVKGSNNHGLFSQHSTELKLIVLPNWWQDRKILSILLLMVIGIILAFHQYRLRHVRQINRLLHQSVQERSKAQLILESKVAERTQALEESSLTLSLRSKQLEKSLAEIAKANRELKRLDKLKDEFIAVVSHELRTPLTSIRGAVGLIAHGVVEQNSEAYQLLIATAVNNCERLSTIINDLLDVQKFAAGKFVLQLETTKFVQLTQDAVTANQIYGHKYNVGVVLHVQCAEDLELLIDPLRIRQVMDNLLSNAIKFSRSEGEVQVHVMEEPTHIRFEVKDEGVGIPQAFQSRVFEKFSQADASDSRTKEGTGLGLTICKNIIESHHGKIGFTSVEGQGSTFWFTLPKT